MSGHVWRIEVRYTNGVKHVCGCCKTARYHDVYRKPIYYAYGGVATEEEPQCIGIDDTLAALEDDSVWTLDDGGGLLK